MNKRLPQTDDERSNLVYRAIENVYASQKDLENKADRLNKVEKNRPDLKKMRNGEMRAVFDGTTRKIYIKIGSEVWSITATKEM